MKYQILYLLLRIFSVTPFAGVWIEIIFAPSYLQFVCVTPFAGVWIEIGDVYRSSLRWYVTPFAGVWIEIKMSSARDLISRHSLRGSVD